ncbi:MAG: hypothetical protein ACSHWU_04240 [Marinicella sp.]
MNIKPLLIATALFFSFQASASSAACRAAEESVRNAEREVERIINQGGFGTPEHRQAIGALGVARSTRFFACEFQIILTP